uniref:Uncharacterized protein n=1 Tax=Vespula pensylvanica TaxID=30213 RepID=A0A834P417_VESPE|nr:hypothetical protein H0235_007066 [Vespula pensylvanica]
MATVRGKRDNFKSTLAASFPGPGSDLSESLRAWQREYRFYHWSVQFKPSTSLIFSSETATTFKESLEVRRPFEISEIKNIFKKDIMERYRESFEKNIVREEFVRREKYRKFVRLTVNFKEEEEEQEEEEEEEEEEEDEENEEEV